VTGSSMSYQRLSCITRELCWFEVAQWVCSDSDSGGSFSEALEDEPRAVIMMHRDPERQVKVSNSPSAWTARGREEHNQCTLTAQGRQAKRL